MAKTQKSFYLDDDLGRLLDGHLKATGASFTRTMTAALLSYLLSDPEGADPYWMEMAVELETGERKIAEKVPITVGGYSKDQRTIEAERDSLIELQRDFQGGLLTLPEDGGKVGPSGEVGTLFSGPGEKEIFDRWQKLIDRVDNYKDPIQGIIDHWRANRRS